MPTAGPQSEGGPAARRAAPTPAATAIGGLTPLALAHSALYSPLAVVMIGGLLASTLLARIVTPVMYLLLPPAIAPGDSRRDLDEPVRSAAGALV